MKRGLERFWHEFRPVVTGWLLAILILPSLLTLLPQSAAANQISPSMMVEFCAQNGKDSPPLDHQNHSCECPCCLPSDEGHVALALPAPPTITEPVRRISSAFVAEAPLVRLSGQRSLVSLARGPPSLINI